MCAIGLSWGIDVQCTAVLLSGVSVRVLPGTCDVSGSSVAHPLSATVSVTCSIHHPPLPSHAPSPLTRTTCSFLAYVCVHTTFAAHAHTHAHTQGGTAGQHQHDPPARCGGPVDVTTRQPGSRVPARSGSP